VTTWFPDGQAIADRTYIRNILYGVGREVNLSGVGNRAGERHHRSLCRYPNIAGFKSFRLVERNACGPCQLAIRRFGRNGRTYRRRRIRGVVSTFRKCGPNDTRDHKSHQKILASRLHFMPLKS
jgi:hypothetical protein